MFVGEKFVILWLTSPALLCSTNPSKWFSPEIQYFASSSLIYEYLTKQTFLLDEGTLHSRLKQKLYKSCRYVQSMWQLNMWSLSSTYPCIILRNCRSLPLSSLVCLRILFLYRRLGLYRYPQRLLTNKIKYYLELSCF